MGDLIDVGWKEEKAASWVARRGLRSVRIGSSNLHLSNHPKGVKEIWMYHKYILIVLCHQSNIRSTYIYGQLISDWLNQLFMQLSSGIYAINTAIFTAIIIKPSWSKDNKKTSPKSSLVLFTGVLIWRINPLWLEEGRK